MKPTKPSIIAILIIFLGWFLMGLGYGETIATPWNTVLYISGVVLFFVGLLATVYLVFR